MRRAFICPERQLHSAASIAGGERGQQGAAAQGAGEQGGKVAGLFVEMHRGEHQFDGPFGGQALGLQRVGKAKAADGQIGAGGAGAGELFVDVLTFGDHRAFGQQGQFRGQQIAVQEGGADLDRGHAAFAGQEAGERDFKLAVGEEEDRLAVQGLARRRRWPCRRGRGGRR